MSQSRSNVKVKVAGQGQMSRSIFGRAAVDIRGSALPSKLKGCPQAIAHSDCAIYSYKLRYLLFRNYCRITVI